MRIKVEHDRLFSETILVMDLGCNLVEVLVNRLLNIQRIALDSVYMPFDISQSNHPLLDLPVRPDRLDAVGSSLLDDLVDRELCPALSPLVCLEGVLDCSNSSHSLQKPLEEENHLLILVNVDCTIIIKDREANCDGDVQPGRLEDQEVFVLVLEHKLIDEWILFEALECLLQLLHVEMAAPIRQNFESSVSPRLVVAENIVTKREVWISEFVWRQRLVILHLEVAMDWFRELDQRQWLTWKHIWFCDSDRIVLLILFQALHQIFKLNSMLIFKQRHQFFDNLDENRLLLFQNVDSWIFTELQSVNETRILDISHSVICLQFQSCCDSTTHCFLLDVVLHHRLVDSACCCSFPELNVRHHEVLFIGVAEHVFEVLLQLESQKETTSYLLNFHDLLPSLIEVNLDIVSGPVSTIETLNQNTWTVSLKYSPQSVHVDLKIEKVLLS